MNDFQITQIAPRAYHILDSTEASFYLVIGEQRAAVIDTGISVGYKIRPVIEQLTNKPLILIITHAHIDHFHHMDEFDTVYMCHEELTMPADVLKEMMAGKELKLEQTIDIRTGDLVELGGEELEICQVPGHTPGSVVVWARQQNLLFTGDAIGSGYGVWMHTPCSVTLSRYRESLCFMMKWLVERGGRMRFFGGHNMQQFQSSYIPNYNPLNLGLLADLIDLVDKIIKGEIVGGDSGANRSFSTEPVRYAYFGRAEIQYLRSNIK